MNFFHRTWAEIDIDALIHNFNIIKNTINSKIMAVVKANAYGHSAELVGTINYEIICNISPRVPRITIKGS